MICFIKVNKETEKNRMTKIYFIQEQRSQENSMKICGKTGEPEKESPCVYSKLVRKITRITNVDMSTVNSLISKCNTEGVFSSENLKATVIKIGSGYAKVVESKDKLVLVYKEPSHIHNININSTVDDSFSTTESCEDKNINIEPENTNSSSIISTLISNSLTLLKSDLTEIYDNISLIKKDLIHDLKSTTSEAVDKYMRYFLISDEYMDRVVRIEEEIIRKEVIYRCLCDIYNRLDNNPTYCEKNLNVDILFNTLKSFLFNTKHSLTSFRTCFMENMNIKYSIKNDKVNKTIEWISLITFLFLPIQAISGIFGMNVRVPFENEKSLGYFCVLVMITPVSWMMFYGWKKIKGGMSPKNRRGWPI